MKHSKFKLRNKSKKNYVIIVLFLILFCSYYFLTLFNHNVNPKLERVVEVNIDKMIDNMLNEYSLEENYNTIKDIIIINKGNNGEITNIDFDLEKIYLFLKDITYKLRNDLNNLENCTKNEFVDNYLHKKNNHYILMAPLGVASNNIYFSNFGPKIPVEIKFSGSIITGVKNEVKDYGINNSLIEVYATVNINTLLLTPVTNKKKEYTYNILIASKIVEGKVPELYSGILNKNDIN